jgi:hypothetical protein
MDVQLFYLIHSIEIDRMSYSVAGLQFHKDMA